MTTEHMRQLYAKCLTGAASPEERLELLQWLALPENEQLAKEWLLEGVIENDRQSSFDNSTAEAMIHAIVSTGAQPPKLKKIPYARWTMYAAAVFLLIVGSALFWFFSSSHQSTNHPLANHQEDIPAGHRGAVLTLSNGREIVLDSLSEGTINLEDGAQAMLRDSGLAYNPAQAGNASLNMLSTPNGRKFDIRLSDGTHVWLNAASSVTFPVAFNTTTRNIKVTGEVYIEVAHNKRPFLVNVNDKASIRDIGTSFNIKAYRDESSLQTTLVSGVVAVTANGKEKNLKPGQQASLFTGGEFTVSNNADIEAATAWKNGVFSFSKADIQTVMRELARWYDINVVYQGTIPKREFTGNIGSDLTLSQVLKGLANMGVHVEVSGRIVTVMP